MRDHLSAMKITFKGFAVIFILLSLPLPELAAESRALMGIRKSIRGIFPHKSKNNIEHTTTADAVQSEPASLAVAVSY